MSALKTASLILVTAVSSAAIPALADMRVVSSKVVITRDIEVLSHRYVKNEISAVLEGHVEAGLVLKVFPFRCETEIPAPRESYSFARTELLFGLSEINAVKYYDISGNNGYVDFSVFLCAYDLEGGRLVDQHVLGTGEYFLND